ncbi:MAG: hypothetical protein WD055_00380 [Candidatus Dependentiae bacterium]
MKKMLMIFSFALLAPTVSAKGIDVKKVYDQAFKECLPKLRKLEDKLKSNGETLKDYGWTKKEFMGEGCMIQRVSKDICKQKGLQEDTNEFFECTSGEEKRHLPAINKFLDTKNY